MYPLDTVMSIEVKLSVSENFKKRYKYELPFIELFPIDGTPIKMSGKIVQIWKDSHK